MVVLKADERARAHLPARHSGCDCPVRGWRLAIWLTVPWIEHGLDRGQLIALGIGWAAATVLFELGFGHWIAGHPWSRLLADYDLLAGRIWVLVLLTVLVGPAVAGAVRRRVTGDGAQPIS